MKQGETVAYYNDDCACGWLRNATKKEFSSATFALVGTDDDTSYQLRFSLCGVRPGVLVG